MKRFFRTNVKALSWASALLMLVIAQFSSAGNWPQELPVEGGTIVVYQPQPEELNGKTLKGRAAMSIEMESRTEPIYGVFWFTSFIETDRDEDTVSFSNIAVTKVTWPDSKDTGEQRFKQAAEKALNNASFEASLAGMTAALTTSQNVQKSLEDIITIRRKSYSAKNSLCSRCSMANRISRGLRTVPTSAHLILPLLS